MAKKKGKGKGNNSSGSGTSNKNGGKNKASRQQRSNNNKKWEQDNDGDDTNFRNSLLNQGHTIQEMDADGNCLFRSLSDQLYGDRGSKHDVVRHDVCNHLSKNKEEFQHFLLMADDDEDVVGIDEYIAKMREDGEWGGNVEIVVASKVYKRNIIVFSGEYSNGALHIMCDEKEKKDGDDLLLSYHGNDHYNSVHIIGGPKKQSNTRSSDNGASSASSTIANNKKKKGKAQHASNTDETTQEKEMVDNKPRSRPPTRGSNCPCGSGLKYKKCCMAAEKSKKRLAKHMEKPGIDDGDADEKKEDEFIGEFKVLTI